MMLKPNFLEKAMMLEKVEGKRRGWPAARWMDSVTLVEFLSINEGVVGWNKQTISKSHSSKFYCDHHNLHFFYLATLSSTLASSTHLSPPPSLPLKLPWSLVPSSPVTLPHCSQLTAVFHCLWATPEWSNSWAFRCREAFRCKGHPNGQQLPQLGVSYLGEEEDGKSQLGSRSRWWQSVGGREIK